MLQHSELSTNVLSPSQTQNELTVASQSWLEQVVHFPASQGTPLLDKQTEDPGERTGG